MHLSIHIINTLPFHTFLLSHHSSFFFMLMLFLLLVLIIILKIMFIFIPILILISKPIFLFFLFLTLTFLLIILLFILFPFFLLLLPLISLPLPWSIISFSSSALAISKYFYSYTFSFSVNPHTYVFFCLSIHNLSLPFFPHHLTAQPHCPTTEKELQSGEVSRKLETWTALYTVLRGFATVPRLQVTNRICWWVGYFAKGILPKYLQTTEHRHHKVSRGKLVRKSNYPNSKRKHPIIVFQ